MTTEATAPQVLLVDADGPRLTKLAGALGDRGIDVAASGDARVLEEPWAADGPGIILIAEASLRRGGVELDALLRRRGTPYLVLVGDPDAVWTTSELHHGDIDLIVRRVSDVLRLSAPLPWVPEPRVGELSRASLLTLVRAFLEGGVSGGLSVTTADGAGELRFVRGELVDAVFSKLEGVKAFFRMLREEDGEWAYTEASPLVVRRITRSTADLVRAATSEIERVENLLASLGDLGGFALLVERDAGAKLGVMANAVAARLVHPTPLAALLDESPELDGDVLGGLFELERSGLLRRVPLNAHAAAFESPAQWSRVVALTAGSRAAGFRGPARVVFAGPRSALTFLAYAAGHVDEAAGSSSGLPLAPVPSTMAILRVGDDAAIELVALPLDPSTSPLWPLALAGAVALVTLDAPGAHEGRILRELCAAVDLPMHDARAIVPELDCGSPEHLARLVRAALDAEPRADAPSS